jgi:hypothetical protein
MKIFLIATSLFIIFTSQSFGDDSRDDDCTEKNSFRTVDVSVDSRQNALAAYQVDIRYDNRKIKIVGLEGGAEGFSEPPFYDRAGLDGGHIIIASFVDNDLKAEIGKTRVARLHIQTTGCPPFELKAEPTAGAKPGGEDIPIKVEIAFVDAQSVKKNED